MLNHRWCGQQTFRGARRCCQTRLPSKDTGGVEERGGYQCIGRSSVLKCTIQEKMKVWAWHVCQECRGPGKLGEHWANSPCLGVCQKCKRGDSIGRWLAWRGMPVTHERFFKALRSLYRSEPGPPMMLSGVGMGIRLAQAPQGTPS